MKKIHLLAAILFLVPALVLPSFADIYDNTTVNIGHDPVPYAITGYNVYIACPESAPDAKILLASDVIDGAVISVDLPSIGVLEFCVTAMVSTGSGPAESGPFAYQVIALTDIVPPANGTLSIDIVCKNPACTKITVEN